MGGDSECFAGFLVKGAGGGGENVIVGGEIEVADGGSVSRSQWA